MRLDILSSKTPPSVIQGFIAFLIKDSALNDLCGKTLDISSFYSDKAIYYAKICFERHFEGDDQKNAILTPLIDCHGPGRIVSREQFQSMCLSIYSTVKQKKKKKIKLTHF